jgi:23S rRNA (uracil1939-C5)-methyltransferase
LVDIHECKVTAKPINEEIERIRKEPALNADEPIKIELYLGKDGKVHRFDNVPHSFSGFAQIHSGQNEVLRNLVSNLIRENKAKKVLELYCGDGNLTFSYLDQVDNVWGFDASRSAIEAARIQRRAEDQSKVVFFADKVDSGLIRRLPQEIREYDTLILDPPRQGTLGALSKFLHGGLKTVIYVSCSPVTFSQDVQCLKKEFLLKSVQPIDMFPNTRHVELVAVWVRR